MLNGPKELDDWRTRRGLRTQQQLADYLGWHPTYISHLMSGRRTPDLPNALHIEKMTGIPVEAWANQTCSGETRTDRAAGRVMPRSRSQHQLIEPEATK